MTKRNELNGTEELSATDMFEKEGTQSFSVQAPITDGTVEVGSTDYRNLLAKHTVKSWSIWASAAGLIPVPVFDFAAISSLQVKMIYDLCKIYDIPYKKETVKSLLGGLAGGALTVVASSYLSTRLFRWMPYAGPVLSVVIQPSLAFTSTFTLGHIFIRRFESGQSLAGLTAESLKSAYQAQVPKAKSLFKKKGQDSVIEVLDPATGPTSSS